MLGRSRIAALFILITLGGARTAVAQARPARWSMELFGGTSFSARTPFTVVQEGQPELEFTATWATRPFHSYPYYAYRITHLDSLGRKGWAFDFTHQKIYLDNRPPEIQRFEISHGYNLFIFSRLWVRHDWNWSVGGGAVVGHPEDTVRGLQHLDDDGGTFGGGYYLCGVAAEAAAGRRVRLSRKFFASALTKLSAATCHVPVRNGWAEAPNVAFHLNLGVGARW